MSKRRSQELISLGDRLFAKKAQLDTLCQEIAWQFCPDLADFISPLVLGDDWAADRMDGFPELISRELSNNIGAMLRPQDKPWFRSTTLDDAIDADEENARGLQYVTSVIRRNLYNPKSKFIRATKETDRFYVNFGQGVLSIEEAPGTRDHLFFRCHHLKNCAWLENDLGDVDHLHRKDKMTARMMMARFPSSRLHASIKDAAEKEPGHEFPLRVVIMPSDEYDTVQTYSGDNSGKKRKLPFVMVYIDVENQTIIKEASLPEFIYVVPRWHRFAESQYAFSPATMGGLADARMAQMLSQIILEAGEKAVDPPMIGKQEVVIGEPNIMAGAISWVDMEHDDDLKKALDVINISADLRVGFEMRKDIREMLTKSFFVDKLSMPPAADRATAYETSIRLEEHIRNLLPLFEPMQVEYNTRVLDLSFALLRNMRAFNMEMIPDALAGQDFTWTFESPIQRAQDAVLVEQFKGSLEVMALGLQGGALSKPLIIDRAMRDAIRGVGGPATWRKTAKEQQAEAEQAAQERMIQKAMAQVGQGAQIASQAGDAANKLGLQPSADKKLMAQAKAGGGMPAGAMGGGEQGGDQGGGQGGSPEDFGQAQLMEFLKGGGEQGGGQGGQPMQATPLQPQDNNLGDVLKMQKAILAQLSELNKNMSKPKKVKIERGKDGKIVSASAT